ncbi:hypothetical protein ACQKLX_28145 [Bosea sp. NPDC003192]|uniref:hypothetical protein n=1 Tax=Bosea sp. NPDC003192 TaxID=3390551 RepID=UPI003CFF3132
MLHDAGYRLSERILHAQFGVSGHDTTAAPHCEARCFAAFGRRAFFVGDKPRNALEQNRNIVDSAGMAR